MKRCPTCNRVESDQALKFRRFDGVTLKHAIELDPNSTVAHFRYGLYPAWIFIPPLDSLREDARFKDLPKRMNLPECSLTVYERTHASASF